MKSTEKVLYFRKLYIPFSEYGQNVPGTILFREPNNIVSPAKPYCFVRESQIFGR
ncbi:unknown [Bacteroides sp. CAG:462]|nr:unknown [Bacteroides sp. CAG:462]